jgi:hypothetical protein
MKKYKKLKKKYKQLKKEFRYTDQELTRFKIEYQKLHTEQNSLIFLFEKNETE